MASRGLNSPAWFKRLWGLHTKVALVALTLLVIPWVGYSYVKAMEKLLRENQEQQVAAAARGIATALQDRPRLLELHGVPKKITEIKNIDTALLSEGELVQADPNQPAPEKQEPPKPIPPPTPTDESLKTSASEEVRTIVSGLARAGLRIWVIDPKLQLVAAAGSLDTKPKAANDAASFGPLEKAVNAALTPLFTRMFPPPVAPDEEFIPNDVIFGGKELERALDGTPSLRRRSSAQRRTAILSAAHPIWVGDKVVGVVVVEETTDAIVSLGNRAFQQLTAVTLIAFAAVALVLLLFASRLSWRLRRLRDEAESAIDSQGRIQGIVTGERAVDEIGDLSRAFTTMLERLAHYNAHLENLAQRLTHELRTPIAVVRGSLDNVRLQALPGEANVYVERAEGGLHRLETILTRMSEATRLEQAVRNEERELFDARAVLAGCVSGYGGNGGGAYPRATFELTTPDTPVMLKGAPDLYAQMLDKLAANAADFALAGTPIAIKLSVAGDEAVLRFDNQGPTLAPETAQHLFNAMTSARKEASGDNPHLGLGLYIVRLIAEFHGGKAGASNWPNDAGVTFEIRMPVAQQPAIA